MVNIDGVSRVGSRGLSLYILIFMGISRKGKINKSYPLTSRVVFPRHMGCIFGKIWL